MIGLPQERMQESASSYSLDQQLLLQVVPPRAASSRYMAALETVMQGLALDTRHQVALEIARTESGRQFLVRATSRAGYLAHLFGKSYHKRDRAGHHSLHMDVQPG